jgi:flagellar basal body-associated protein FliL
MAEKKEEKTERADKKETAPAAAPPAEISGSKKLGLMIGIIAGMMLVLSIISYFIILSLRPQDPELLAQKIKQQKEEVEREKMTEMGATLKSPIEVVVNLSGDNERFLKASLVLEYMGKEGDGGEKGEGGGDPEIVKRLPKLKDIAIDILSSKAYEEVKDRDGRRKVLTMLKNEMNKVFPEPEKIKNVYFDSFIVQ